jgi:hypothetical protein
VAAEKEEEQEEEQEVNEREEEEKNVEGEGEIAAAPSQEDCPEGADAPFLHLVCPDSRWPPAVDSGRWNGGNRGDDGLMVALIRNRLPLYVRPVPTAQTRSKTSLRSFQADKSQQVEVLALVEK